MNPKGLYFADIQYSFSHYAYAELEQLPQRTLHVHTPFLRIKPKSLESTLLAKALRLIYKFIAAVVSYPWVSLRIFVCRESHVRPVRAGAKMRLSWMHGGDRLMEVNVLCMGLPSAPRTAWEVKFSDGIRLMKYFCLSFSCTKGGGGGVKTTQSWSALPFFITRTGALRRHEPSR